MCSGAHDHSNYDQGGADQSDVSAAHEVGKRANERTDSGKSEQIGEDLIRSAYAIPKPLPGPLTNHVHLSSPPSSP